MGIEKACKVAGVDEKQVRSIARRLSKAAKEAQELDLVIFGWAGTGFLVHEESRVMVAGLSPSGVFDGGDPDMKDHGDYQTMET